MKITEEQALKYRKAALEITNVTAEAIDDRGASIDIALGSIGYLIVSMALREAEETKQPLSAVIHKMYGSISGFVQEVALPESLMVQQVPKKEIH